MSTKKRGLGRGLDALLGIGQNAPDAIEEARAGGQLQQIPIEQLQRGKYQPRRDMRQESLEELANSIKAQGVMQPITVRAIGHQKYEIVAGERRWRATQLAGLDTIPAIVRDIDDNAAIAMALIENIQREDLNPMEEAVALQRLQDEFALTQQQVAEAVGKSRAAVANLLRLLNLNEEVKKLLIHGDLEMGHARALLALDSTQQARTAKEVARRGLSVRQTEGLVRQLCKSETSARKIPATKADPNINKLQHQLSEKLGAAVTIDHASTGKGKIQIAYNSLDELDGILKHIK
jgi:ParB family chromosome partitioning protein